MSDANTRSHTPATRLVGTLAGAGAIAGLLMVLLFLWADPQIQAHAASETMTALNEVLSAPAHIVPLYVEKTGLTQTPPAGTDTADADRVYAAYTKNGKLLGFGAISVEPGFSELLTIAFGYDPRTRSITGMKVLDSKETPGIADAILTDSFANQFRGRQTPLKGVKPERRTADKHEVDMISGATISSRALIGAVNHRIAALQPLMDAYARGNHK